MSKTDGDDGSSGGRAEVPTDQQRRAEILGPGERPARRDLLGVLLRIDGLRSGDHPPDPLPELECTVVPLSRVQPGVAIRSDSLRLIGAIESTRASVLEMVRAGPEDQVEYRIRFSDVRLARRVVGLRGHGEVVDTVVIRGEFEDGSPFIGQTRIEFFGTED